MAEVSRHDLPTGTIWYYDEPHLYCHKAPEDHGVGRCSYQCRSRIPSASDISKCDGDTGTFGRGIRYGERITVEGIAAEAGASEDRDWLSDPMAIHDRLEATKRTARAQRDSAGDRGTASHAVLEALARGEEPHTLIGYDLAVVDWWDYNQPEPVEVEAVVYSAEHDFTGRFDLFARRFRRTAKRLSDLKTSKGVYNSHAIQLNLYEVGRREMGLEPADSLSVVVVRENGNWSEYPIPFHPDRALNALRSYRDGKQITSELRKAEPLEAA